MSFGLGFWAAAGAGGGAAAGAYEQIATTILSSDTSSVLFSSIPSTYKHVQIRYTAKSQSTSNSNKQVLARLNSAASVYSAHLLSANGSTVTSTAFLSESSMIVGYMTDAASGANNMFGAGIIDILDYANSTTFKTSRSLFGVKDQDRVGLVSGSYRATTAVSSIEFFAQDFAGFKANTRFSLYGIKG